MSSAMVPLSSFKLKSAIVNILHEEIQPGTGPERKLLLSSKNSKEDMFLTMSFGIRPDKLLLAKSRERSEEHGNECGTEPDMLLLESFSS